MCGFLRLIFDVNEMNPAIKIENFAVFFEQKEKAPTKGRKLAEMVSDDIEPGV